MSIIYETYYTDSILGKRKHISRNVGSVHTPECWAIHAKVEKLRADFYKQYPGACLECAGAGGAMDLGSWDCPPDWGDCESCLQLGLCPLCGTELGEDSNLDECPNGMCSWTFETNPPIAGPRLYECWDCKPHPERW